MTEESKQTDLLTKKTEYNNATEWEISLDNRYNEDEVLSIMNILSYWENKHRGYGKRNDEQIYREEREADKNNRLYEEAMRGLSLLETGRRVRKNKRL
jgi:hypothetical protein